MSFVASAAQYLCPSAHSFWKWHDNETVIAWPDGTTIVFRQELRLVLARLAPDGLPPLESVVLLLAACRDSWPIASHQFVTNYSTLAGSGALSLPPWFVELPGRLDEIHRLPRAARQSPEAQAALAGIVFEGTRRLQVAGEAVGVLAALDSHDEAELEQPLEFAVVSPLSRLFPSLQPLAEGLARFDPNSLELRRQTGLDQLVEPAEVELAAAEQARALISDLEDDEELGGVARVARRLLALATLPRPLAESEELPLGGVSDISNRGPLDRLLISELAHDDLTLAVRVAMNEALYMRRETPPRNPPRRRAVLVDAGLRTWGVPRVFAAAVALALTAASEPQAQVLAYRAEEDQPVPADLSTRAGLIAHLAALATQAHPAAALKGFFEQHVDDGRPFDAVLITTDDVLADQEFQRLLAALSPPPFFIAAVNRAGGFRLIHKTPRGAKLLREAQFDLESLLASRAKPSVPLVDPSSDALWPAIFSATPFPLLLSAGVDLDKAWPVEFVGPNQGVFSITNDRRLLHWITPKHGARQLSDQMPKGVVHWYSPQGCVEFQVVVGPKNSPHLRLVTINLASQLCHVTELEFNDARPPRGVFSHGQTLFVAGQYQVMCYSLTDGQRLQTLSLPNGLEWKCGRFFKHGRGLSWEVMSFDGIVARLERLPIIPASHSIAVFERLGEDGIIGILPGGILHSDARSWPAFDSSFNFNTPVALIAISANGNRVVLSGNRGGEQIRYVIEVDSGKATRISGDPRLAIEPALAQIPRPVSLRNKFATLHLSARGELVLTSNKGKPMRIMLDDQQDQVCLRPAESVSLGDTVQLFSFEPRVAPRDVGYTLREANWGSGRAILDSRGLLHLQRLGTATTEATLVLCDGAIGIWTSDGRLAGKTYFSGGLENASPGDLYRQVIRPILQTIG